MSWIKDYFVPRKPEPRTASDGEHVHSDIELTTPLRTWNVSRMQWPTDDDNATTPASPPLSLRESSSLYPPSTATPSTVQDVRSEVMASWLNAKQEEKIWTRGNPGEGVILKRSKGRYVTCPVNLQCDGTVFYQMVARLNLRVGLLVSGNSTGSNVLGGDDCQHEIHQDDTGENRDNIHRDQAWASHTSFTFTIPNARLPETSRGCLRER
jgi:hypothetical protein